MLKLGLILLKGWVTTGGGKGTRERDAREGLEDIENILWLGVEFAVVDAGIVDAVLFSAGDADLHLEPEVEFCHAGEVFDAGGDVLFLGLFGKVKHVR